MLMMYCPNCEMNIITKRDDFRYLLAFILALTGIGLVIYILYYFDKKKDLCVHCETKCQTKQLKENQTNIKESLQYNTQNSLEYKDSELEKETIEYCHNCGTRIGNRDNIQFCMLCGSSIN